MVAQSSRPISLLKDPPPNTITLGAGLWHTNLGGGGAVITIANIPKHSGITQQASYYAHRFRV